jgi:hypothetical protein
VGHATDVGGMRSPYTGLVENSLGKQLLGDGMDLRETGCENGK